VVKKNGAVIMEALEGREKRDCDDGRVQTWGEKSRTCGYLLDEDAVILTG
jgi:hypothetical protein